MEKVYLIYDQDSPIVECDYGFIFQIIYLGFLYPIKKGNYFMFYIMWLVQVSVSILIMLFIPFVVGIITCVLFIALINLLFAFNYNVIVIEQLLKKGYSPADYNSSQFLIEKRIYFKFN